MDHFQGITAEVVSNGQVLDFYEDPDAAGNEENRARHLYVEAVPGTTFQVKVTLTPKFNLYEMKAEDAVKILVDIDGRNNSARFKRITKKDLQRNFSTREIFEYTFVGPKHFCMQTGQWMQSDYSFSNLILKETQDPGISVKEAQNLGRVRVTVTRVTVKRVPAYARKKTPIATVNEIPEKALKGRPIETIIRQVDYIDICGLTAKVSCPSFANARPISEPPLHYKHSTSIGGEAGKPIVFDICYRSRRALQILGCIPRSPSPEVSNPTDESTAAGDAIQEIKDLRARLAILERNLQVKSEPTSTHRNLKREPDEELDRGSVQRRRLDVKVEHVDLTGD
ncbi:hypothetical protein BDR22DRAFT_886811 [Usnea florida]